MKKGLLLLPTVVLLAVAVLSTSASADMARVYYSNGWKSLALGSGDYNALGAYVGNAGVHGSTYKVWYSKGNDLGEVYLDGSNWQTRTRFSDKTYTKLAGSFLAQDEVYAATANGAVDRIRWSGSSWARTSTNWSFTQVNALAENHDTSKGAWFSATHSNGYNYVAQFRDNFTAWNGANVQSHTFTTLADETNALNHVWASGDGTGIYRMYYSGGYQLQSIGVSAAYSGSAPQADLDYINSYGFDKLAPTFSRPFAEAYGFWGMNGNGIYYVRFNNNAYQTYKVGTRTDYVDITFDTDANHFLFASWNDGAGGAGVDKLYYSGGWSAFGVSSGEYDMLAPGMHAQNNVWGATLVPEPATVLLLVSGGALALLRRRR